MRPPSAVRRLTALMLWAVVLTAAAASVVAFLVLRVGVDPVLSGSMRGTFDPGAAVFTRVIPTSSLHVGEVVEFYPPGSSQPYTHRVVSEAGDPRHPVITTKGDANPAVDPWHAQLTGDHVRVVVGSVPTLGRVIVWLDHDFIRPALIGVLGLLATAYGMTAIVRRPGDVHPA